MSRFGAALLQADVFHGRNGRVRNSFTYRTDFVFLAIDDPAPSTLKFLSRNRFNLWNVRDRDYGDATQSLMERADALRRRIGRPQLGLRTFLLTQPACLGYCFNPVSFWFFLDDSGDIRAVVSEVNNTSGDRHSYLVAHADLSPIRPDDRINVRKIFHVSPFQPVDGAYEFSFRLEPDRASIGVNYCSDADDGLKTSLSGRFLPLTDARLLGSFLKLPFGAARVSVLILWQALKLKLKKARFRSRPHPPAEDLTS